MGGFIKERDRQEFRYRGYRITVEYDRVTVHAQDGFTRAEFGSMPVARAFVRMLRRNARAT